MGITGGKMETVKVKIAKDGTISFDCNGFVGTNCDIVRGVEQAMGSVSTSQQKAEAFIHDNPDVVEVTM